MAKQTFSDINEIVEKRIKKSQRILSSKPFLRAMGDFIVMRIVKRTKLGYGVEKRGKKRSNLKALSPDYKIYRNDNKDSLDGTTSPFRSNLTFTGDMLKHIISKIVNKSIVITGKDKFTKDKIKWNQDDIGTKRRFLELSDKDINAISKRVRNVIRKIITK